jgi:hypothetical protein
VEHQFLSFTDPSGVTVRQLRDAADNVHAELAVVIEEGQPLRAVRPQDVAEADEQAAIAGFLTPLAEPVGTPPVEPGVRVAAGATYAIVVRSGEALLVPTEDPLHWSPAVASPVEAYAPAARAIGNPQPLPDPPIECSCPYGDVVRGSASAPPTRCARGHPVRCQ